MWSSEESCELEGDGGPQSREVVYSHGCGWDTQKE